LNHPAFCREQHNVAFPTFAPGLFSKANTENKVFLNESAEWRMFRISIALFTFKDTLKKRQTPKNPKKQCSFTSQFSEKKKKPTK